MFPTQAKERHPRASAARPGDPGKTKIPYFHLDPRMSHALTACSSEDDIPLSPGSSYLSIALLSARDNQRRTDGVKLPQLPTRFFLHGTTRGELSAHPAGAQQAVPAKMPRGKTPGHFQAQQK